MLAKLPAWAVDNAESVRREAAPYRGLPPEGKLELVALACRAAARLLESSPNRARALAYVDPLPESSVVAIRRLMHRYKEGRAKQATGAR